MCHPARLLMLSTALIALAAGAKAQEAAPPVEAVTVTGTNIKGVEDADLIPLQVLSRDDLLNSGSSLQMSDILKNVPANTGSTAYNESGQLVGTAQFELRGLGYSSTLVLVNGHRAGVAPLSDKSGADFLDINQFPLGMVQRIDVLKDGSSAIYGSEAVAGVVNIVTRKGFDGLEVSVDGESSTDQAYSVNLAFGASFPKGQINFYATYYDQTRNNRTDFPWLVQRVGGNGNLANSQLLTSNGYPGTYQKATIDANGKPEAVAGATSVPDPNCQAAGGVFAATSTGAINSNVCQYNFADQTSVVPEEHRYQGFVELSYDVADNVHYFGEYSASDNKSYVTYTPGSFTNGSAVGSALGDIYVPASSPFNFFIADPSNAKNVLYVPPSQWNNATDTAVGVVATFRPQGNYYYANQRLENEYFRMLNGVNFDLPFGWSGTLDHELAIGKFTQTSSNAVNAGNLNNLLLNGQYDPFALSVLQPTLVSPKNGSSTAGNPSSVLNQIFYTSVVERRTEQQVVDLSANGALLDLPTGKVSAAVGGQYRLQSLSYNPDSLTAAGGSNTPATDASFRGTEHVFAGFAELIVPLTSLADVQLAVRHEDYGKGIGATTDPKASARVTVLPGLLDLRGSWGTSFQAPTLTQNATSQALVIVNDPVAYGNAGLVCSATTTGSNTLVVTSGGNLKPQRSHNFSAGINATPLDNWQFTADYWNYDYSNLIAAGLNGQAIVNSECGGGQYTANPAVQRGPSGQLIQVNTAYTNIGKVKTDGVDLSSTYKASLDTYGDLSLRADATWTHAFDVYGANGTVSHDVGSRNYNNNFAPMPYWRGSASAGWTLDANRIDLTYHYIGGYKNDQSNNGPVDSYQTVDLQYQRDLGDFITGTTSVAVGADNIFDADPPALQRRNASGQLITGPLAFVDRPGYDPLGGADVRGRIVYLRLIHGF